MTSVQRREVNLSPLHSIPTFYRMLLRGQLTRGRLFGLGVLAGFAVLLAAVSRTAIDKTGAGVDVVVEYGISLLIPLAAVVLAVPMLGNLIEDRLLVYLWLKPVPRWHLAVASVAAVVTVLIPAVVLPVGLAAAITGMTSLIGPAILAAVMGALAYGAVYVYFGSRFSWGLWLALVYLALWENLLSRLSDGTGRLSIRSYLVTIVGWGTDRHIDLADRSSVAAIVVPIAVAVVATVLIARTLQRRDVD